LILLADAFKSGVMLLGNLLICHGVLSENILSSNYEIKSLYKPTLSDFIEIIQLSLNGVFYLL
jgi:hypothetical protein